MPRLLPSGVVVASGTRQSGISSQYNRRSRLSRSSGTRSTGSYVTSKYWIKRQAKTRSLNRALPGYTSNNPFPPMKRYKLTYDQDQYMTVGTSGTTGTQQKFILNGLYDIDISGTGHQCYGYDAVKIAYNRYKVSGVLVKLECYNIQSLNAIKIVYGILNPMVYTYDIGAKDVESLAEKPMFEDVIIQNIGSGKKTIKFYIPMHVIFQMTKLQYKADIENTTADTSGNPGSKCGLVIAVADPNGNSSGGCRIKTSLTYYSTFYQRDVMAQS